MDDDQLAAYHKKLRQQALKESRAGWLLVYFGLVLVQSALMICLFIFTGALSSWPGRITLVMVQVTDMVCLIQAARHCLFQDLARISIARQAGLVTLWSLAALLPVLVIIDLLHTGYWIQADMLWAGPSVVLDCILLQVTVTGIGWQKKR